MRTVRGSKRKTRRRWVIGLLGIGMVAGGFWGLRGDSWRGKLLVRRLPESASANVRHLVRQLASADATRQHTAIRALSGLGADAHDAVPFLIDLMGAGHRAHEKGRTIGFEATLALSAIGPSASDALVGALQDKNATVRSHAVTGLGLLEDLRAFDLVMQMTRDPHPSVRGHAMEALGVLGDRRAVDVLVLALSDERSRVRKRAATALGRLKDPQAVSALSLKLQDTKEFVRFAAADALGRIGDPGAIEPLIEVLRDASGEVRNAAAQALEAITGQAFGEDHIAWQRWVRR